LRVESVSKHCRLRSLRVPHRNRKFAEDINGPVYRFALSLHPRIRNIGFTQDSRTFLNSGYKLWAHLGQNEASQTRLVAQLIDYYNFQGVFECTYFGG
jgi:hypothetical protein